MKIRVLLLAGLIASAAFAGEEPKHPIDRKVEAAANKANSTAEMVEAQANGLKLWDTELNRVYGELKRRLKPAAFAALQNAQRDWLKYRDSQIKFIGEYYGQFEGTMYVPMQAAAVLEVTRERALDLTKRLQMLEDEGR